MSESSYKVYASQDTVSKQISDALSNFANSFQISASKVYSGTFQGPVYASPTSQVPQIFTLRNSKFVTTATNPTNDGEICWTYE